MKTLAGMALGFAMMPATLGLIAVFAWVGIRFELSKADTIFGAVFGIVTLLAAAAIALRFVR